MIFSPAFTSHSYGVLGDLVDWQAKISMVVTIFQSSKYETGLWEGKNKFMDVQHIWETQYIEQRKFGISCTRLKKQALPPSDQLMFCRSAFPKILFWHPRITFLKRRLNQA
jgi:hypothetical protein